MGWVRRRRRNWVDIVCDCARLIPIGIGIGIGIVYGISANSPPDFWGPVSNFGIPIAAIADMSKDPEMYVPLFLPTPTHTHTHTPPGTPR